MVVDDLFRVGHAAVTDLDGISVEDFSELVARNTNTNTNIGHKFLALLDKHFPKDQKLRKIFTRSTIKIS